MVLLPSLAGLTLNPSVIGLAIREQRQGGPGAASRRSAAHVVVYPFEIADGAGVAETPLQFLPPFSRNPFAIPATL